MQGVLLGPNRRPAHALTILVPHGYDDARIVGVCHICDAKFGEGQEQAWERHVGKCARAHIDEIRANTPKAKQKGTVFDPDSFDPEIESYMLEVGKRMLREGRWEVKPNERAGFS
jgi:hypothetical protein